jgi:PAS domain S-box-containing protein
MYGNLPQAVFPASMDEPSSAVFARYQDLQRYVGWTPADEQRVVAASAIILPGTIALINDFYEEIQRHPQASRVITGGSAQIERLKQTLGKWLSELFSGKYDEAYVARRWRVGLKHVEIGLPQVYAAAALSRLRNGMIRTLRAQWRGGDEEALSLTLQSLNKLLDLDLAIIGDAYETEYVQQQQEAERRKLTSVLHQEKELSAGLLAHAQAAVLILDQQGRIVRCNPFLEHLAGLTREEVQDRDWFDLFLPPGGRAPLRRALLESAPADSPATTVSSTLDCDGEQRHLHWSSVPLRDAEGHAFAILVIGHDVTDLHEAQRRALQAERLAAIGQMATGLAHESRNALQRIGASAEMLELEVEGNAAALDLLARIQQSQTHLHQLLDEVRNYAAPVVLDTSACRISEVWREAWELLHAQRASRQAVLREHLAAKNLWIEGDQFRLVQVFRNLLENSLSACGDAAEIDITCEAARLNNNLAIRVRVRDDGPGLSAEQRRRIFEPFYTTKPTGTGLGMAIAQRIVEAHGGTIAVGDGPLPGAEIIITLPSKTQP